MENFVIRAAALADTPVLYSLMCELEEQPLPCKAFEAVLQRQLQNPDCYCFVCEVDGAVGGMLNLRVEGQLHHAGMVAEIMELVVKSDYRSMGIGKRLLSAARKKAKELGCVSLEVCSNQRRARAHAFYEQQGLQKTHVKLTMALDGIEE